MLNPEGFRKLLVEKLTEKPEKEEGLSRKPEEGVDWNKLPGILMNFVEDQRKNLRDNGVVELDTQLPIKAYLEILKDQITPRQKVYHWGPVNGEIAYAFIYKTGINKVKIGSHEKNWTDIGRATSRGFSFNVPIPRHAIIDDFGLRLTRDIVGVILDSQTPLALNKDLLLLSARHANTPYYVKSFNPLDWFKQEDLSTEGCRILSRISFETPQQGGEWLGQVLADFYVGFKTGQIK